MKKLIAYSSVAALAVFLSGCAMVAPSAQSGTLTGGLYTSVSTPHWVTTNTGSTKSGSASASSILGIVATGDASIQAAAASAGITKIHHVDQKIERILFFWAKYTVTVYGD
ncbi:MAG: TRL-like protein family [Verrucomicrobia bacterium]|nr:TRL-like protein family [Verrucomicrobiota bacterium]